MPRWRRSNRENYWIRNEEIHHNHLSVSHTRQDCPIRYRTVIQRKDALPSETRYEEIEWGKDTTDWKYKWGTWIFDVFNRQPRTILWWTLGRQIMFYTVTEQKGFTVRRDENNHLYVDLSGEDFYRLREGVKQNLNPRQYIKTDALRAVQDLVITQNKPIRAGNPKDGYMLLAKGAFTSHNPSIATLRKI